MIRSVIFSFVCILSANIAQAAVKTETVKYKVGEQEFQGMLAWDDAIQGKRPGVLVFHEWWGLDDYAKGRAEQLAKHGYVAFAADMYGNAKKVNHPKDAGEMAGQVRANVKNWQDRAVAAYDILKANPHCDASKMAAIGYCFGGSTALQLAYTGADLDAVATFHAALPTPSAEQAAKIKASVLICHGADDNFIPQTAIDAFQSALKTAKVTLRFVAYPGAVHSFTVPDADSHNIPGLKYNKAADEQSWADLKKLFDEKLK